MTHHVQLFNICVFIWRIRHEVDLYMEYYLAIKEEWNPDIWDNMDGP